MEYVYAAMTIHKAGGKVDEATVTKVLESAGVKPDSTRVKALVAALENVNIDEAVEKAAMTAPVAVAAAPVAEAKAEKEEVKEEKKEEEAAAGLGALFG